MSHTLHVGLHPDHVDGLETDNDHWEQWGEERPAGEAVHAYVEVDSLVDAVDALARILDSNRELVPMYCMNPHDQNYLELGGRVALYWVGSWPEFRKLHGYG